MVLTRIVGLLFEGACAWVWGNFMRALEELKTTMEEFFVVLGNIVRACFKLFFKRHQNSLLCILM
jgi:hypothetical protein